MRNGNYRDSSLRFGMTKENEELPCPTIEYQSFVSSSPPGANPRITSCATLPFAWFATVGQPASIAARRFDLLFIAQRICEMRARGLGRRPFTRTHADRSARLRPSTDGEESGDRAIE